MRLRRRLERLERLPFGMAAVAAVSAAAVMRSPESLAVWFHRELFGPRLDPFLDVVDAREYLGRLWDWFGVPETESDPLNVELSREVRGILRPHVHPDLRGVLP